MDSQYDVILYLFYAFLCVCFLKVNVHLLLWLWVLQVMHLMLKVPAFTSARDFSLRAIVLKIQHLIKRLRLSLAGVAS